MTFEKQYAMLAMTEIRFTQIVFNRARTSSLLDDTLLACFTDQY